MERLPGNRLRPRGPLNFRTDEGSLTLAILIRAAAKNSVKPPTAAENGWLLLIRYSASSHPGKNAEPLYVRQTRQEEGAKADRRHAAVPPTCTNRQGQRLGMDPSHRRIVSTADPWDPAVGHRGTKGKEERETRASALSWLRAAVRSRLPISQYGVALSAKQLRFLGCARATHAPGTFQRIHTARDGFRKRSQGRGQEIALCAEQLSVIETTSFGVRPAYCTSSRD